MRGDTTKVRLDYVLNVPVKISIIEQRLDNAFHGGTYVISSIFVYI